jgi:stearoyl-CoA desaturase (Delta-9 desaturase)
LQGHELYSKESKNLATLAQYGTSAPEDWLERNIYTPHSYTGIYILLVLNVILFGFIGITIWAVQMLWIPIFAAGIINGIGHWFGYRNFECPDHARNIIPFGILIGGEELHNNHHTFITSAKFSVKWYEFDYGYLWIKVLVMLKLASIKKTIPKLQLHANISPTLSCYEQLERIISNRYMLIITFAKVLKAEYLFELRKTNVKKISWRSAKMLLIKEILSATERDLVNQVCKISPVLHKIFDMRAELATFWQRSSLTKEDLLYKINTWCHQADNSQIHGLRYYALCLRSIA